MTNLDEFFGDDRSRNIDTLVEITKKFFIFVSQLVEIVDELERNYLDLSNKYDQLLQKSESYTLTIPVSKPVSSSISSPSTPPPVPSNLPPSVPSGLPTPPSPIQASAPPPPTQTNPLQAELKSTTLSRPPPTAPTAPSGLPPLPGMSSSPPASSGFGQPPSSPPSFGATHDPTSGQVPSGPPPRPSPMSLKAQMNLELKEAFARIKKGWDEDS